MHWLQNTNQSNVNDLDNVRRETSEHFRKKRMNIRNLKFKNLKLRVK